MGLGTFALNLLVLVPRPLPGFISQLQDIIWEWPGDKASFQAQGCTGILESCLHSRLANFLFVCGCHGNTVDDDFNILL